MGDYGYWAAGLKGLRGGLQKPLQLYDAYSANRMSQMLEEQEYAKNLRKSVEALNLFNKAQPVQPDAMAGYNLSGGQIFNQAGTPQGEYLPGYENYLQTPPVVEQPMALKTAEKPKYKLMPSSIGAQGKLGFDVKEEKTKSIKEVLEEKWMRGEKLTDEQKKMIGIYIAPKKIKTDEWGDDTFGESSLDLRQQAITELQNSGYPITEKNIKEAMRQLGG